MRIFRNLCCVIVFLPLILRAQKENSFWYFAGKAGVKFENGVVKVLHDGALSTIEGCATISDTSGKLLFYTNGEKVWNRKHRIMLNGMDLKGNISSSQSAIIIRRPGYYSRYYIFTANGYTGNAQLGSYYSEVDMGLDSGLGGITSLKNVKLAGPGDEKIAAAIHANGKDIWVFVPERLTPMIHAYLVTDTGVCEQPVSSDIGTVIDGVQGCMRADPAGTYLAVALRNHSKVLLLRIDNSTGRLDSMLTLPVPIPYGLEFSPKGHYLYINSQAGDYPILQYNMLAGSLDSLMNSGIAVYGQGLSVLTAGIHRGGDGRLYFARFRQNYMGVIKEPDRPGLDCEAVGDGIDIQPSICGGSFQNFMFTASKKVVINYTRNLKTCVYHIPFSLSDEQGVKSVKWHFGDSMCKPADDTSYELRPVHIYTTGGKFRVTAIVSYDSFRDTLVRWIHMDKVGDFKGYNPLPHTMVKCPGDTVQLRMIAASLDYHWGNGDTGRLSVVRMPGVYTLKLTDSNGCSMDDTCVVTDRKTHTSLGNDTMICPRDSMLLLELSSYLFRHYKWSTGDSSVSIYVKPGSAYILTTTDSNNCRASDTIQVSQKPFPDFSLGRDTTLCAGQLLEYHFQIPGARYKWQDGDSSAHYSISKGGIYSLELEVSGCREKKGIQVNLLDYPQPDLGGDDSVCANGQHLLDAGTEAMQYEWSTGEQGRFVPVKHTGTFWVMAGNGPCRAWDTAEIYPEEQDFFIPNAFSPDGNQVNDLFRLSQGTGIQKLQIYDRWGELLYFSSDALAAWDGLYKGQVCPPGVYFLVVSYWSCDHRPVFKKQVFHLLR